MDTGIPNALIALRNQLAEYKEQYRQVCEPVENAIRALERVKTTLQVAPGGREKRLPDCTDPSQTHQKMRQSTLSQALLKIVERQSANFSSRTILQEYRNEYSESVALAQVSKFLHYLRRRGQIVPIANTLTPIPISYVLKTKNK